jgi:hypothetical protein
MQNVKHSGGRCKHGSDWLLPHAVDTLDRQVERVMEHPAAKPNDVRISVQGQLISRSTEPSWRVAGPPACEVEVYST